MPGSYLKASNIFASAGFFGEWQAVNEPKIQKLRVILDNFQINK
jgi:hypothetical protein